MALGKKNTVKVNLENYCHLIIGERKIGKSTLMANLAKDVYGDIDKLLLISLGDEDGFHAIDGLVYENPMTWKEFVAIVDELVKNPDDNEFKMIAIDTIDELVNMAIKEVIRMHKVEKQTDCKSINEAFGGYGKGRERLSMLLTEQLTRLKRVKSGLFMIGHNKFREIKQKTDGDPYSIITSNLSADYYNVFAYKADVVCNIVTEKVIEESMLKDTERYMYFRSDGFIDAGSRFDNIPNRVEYGAMNYFKAVEEGIKNSLGKDFSDKEFDKKKAQDAKEKAELAKEASIAETVAESEDGKNEEMVTFIQQKFPNAEEDAKERIKAIMAKHGIKNFKNATELSTEGLSAIVAVLKE